MARRLSASKLEDKLVEIGIPRDRAYGQVLVAQERGRYADMDGWVTIRHFRRGNSFVLKVNPENAPECANPEAQQGYPNCCAYHRAVES